MAFTPDEKLSISKIVGITPTLLDAHLTSLGATLTMAKEDAVRAEITRWDTAGIEFVRLYPTESNYGVETDSGDAKSDIQKNIAIILELPYAVGTATMGTYQIV